MAARQRLARSRERRSTRPIDLRRASFVARARSVLSVEAAAVRGLVDRVGDSLAEAVEAILACPGRVVLTGMGKSGFIAQKLSATFASTGTPSLYLHPAEALHGDLGRVVRDDLVLALSNSGATDELLRLVPAVRRIGARIVAMTGDAGSPLARAADLVLDIGPVDEACPLGLAPTASTLALLAMGDALAMTVLENREFGSDEYALLHPGGSLGQAVRRVAELMRTGPANPVVAEQASLSKAIGVMTRTPGRPGATSVVDKRGKLVGIFTDGDLRRLVESGAPDFSLAVGKVCGRAPKTVRPEQLVRDAAQLIKSWRVDQVPVVDSEGRPVGLLDVQDVLGLKL